jgi:hypothetical protein
MSIVAKCDWCGCTSEPVKFENVTDHSQTLYAQMGSLSHTREQPRLPTHWRALDMFLHICGDCTKARDEAIHAVRVARAVKP